LDGGGSARQFTQGDVDDGRLSYEHRQRRQLADSFRFDVSCGDKRQRGLEFGLDVLSAMIPLDVSGNLTVSHGGSVTLTSNFLKVTRQQFEVCYFSGFLPLLCS